MPESIIIPSCNDKAIKPTANFIGDVYFEPLHGEDNFSFSNVTFTPCARTHWHTHHGGQLIRVLHGSGWVCDKGNKPRRIKAGDTVWCPPGTTHWHGADDNTLMSHFVSVSGKTEWHGPVTDEEYGSKE
ncbi:hypothetical protein H072_518 [Dactylellina haptotyla CBS 200.50]|uniref:Cupin type-2 domain-containing protein n=1 Tax=Dactylellina haptotyla (strain CBS 200.50) TaxID=1284197 RepID=S8AR99_DACHA|nr:hypothetical protein H072_518 [Dactylellina haptotyla CBS 200.50]